MKPVVIIGAPRSGTNMLRDMLTRLPGFATWPCDEINPVWRHGNLRHPSDEFPPELARPRVRAYIRRQFRWVARRYRADWVVEKTCANSLRVGFVDRVVPEARYLFIHRDGLDATASALKRWSAAPEWGYLLRKARFVPPTDLPYYAAAFLAGRLHQWRSAERRIGTWGPRLEGMDELLAQHPLPEVCALQWRACVESAAEALGAMAPGCCLTIGYEDLVRAPEDGLHRILEFLGAEAGAEAVRKAAGDVSAAHVGQGRAELGDEWAERLLPLIREPMARYGYV